MPIKKAIKAKFLKNRTQIFWFVGLYFSSIVALGLFHIFSQWFIEIIK